MKKNVIVASNPITVASTVKSAYYDASKGFLSMKVRKANSNVVESVALKTTAEKAQNMLPYLKDGKLVSYAENCVVTCDYEDGRKYVTTWTNFLRFGN